MPYNSNPSNLNPKLETEAHTTPLHNGRSFKCTFDRHDIQEILLQGPGFLGSR